MGPKSSLLLLLLPCLLLLSSAAAAAPAGGGFNITRFLSQYPEFSTFRDLLNQTHLVPEINARPTITVLAVDNGAIGSITGKPLQVIKRLLSVHVILDYFDNYKLGIQSKKSNLATTLYQASGVADGNEGFINITTLPNRQIGFASGQKGAPVSAVLVRQVETRPYNISLLQVSGVIVTPGIDDSMAVAPLPPMKPVAPIPAPQKKNETEAPAPSPDDEAVADAPEAPTPAEAPEPVSSPPVSGDAPAADDADEEAPAPSKNSAARFASGFFGAAVASILALANL